MRVLILGGSGFLGSHVVDQFLLGGHDVSVYDLSTERYRNKPESIAYFQGDLSSSGILEQVISTGFDAVLHFVSTTTPKTSNASPEFDIQSNLIGTIGLLNICVRHGVKKVVFLSSGGTVYGDIGNAATVDENHAVQPLCSYGVCKHSIEQYLRVYKHLHGLDFVSLRISNPYGERQNPLQSLGAVTVFLHRALTNQPIEIWGDGSVVRDFIYAGDVSNAVYLSTINPVSGVYNVGSGIGRSLLELVDAVSATLGISPKVDWYPGRPYDVPRIVLNASKLQNVTGWSCKQNFLEGLTKTANWLRTLDNPRQTADAPLPPPP